MAHCGIKIARSISGADGRNRTGVFVYLFAVAYAKNETISATTKPVVPTMVSIIVQVLKSVK
ncbi:hypothetical protein CBW42_10300 [Butyricicoccus porcorum]|uniref:Uncharacterized protein n=1 Tax=Butyricicoccus porcorum TaxID=1945634 RepID=A0A252F230_9FIRM|nr:hypothetical protein [Butyricicoccus porcorum]MDD6985901.1 hypothetical protein [Butyricicoccus porcorum]OUM19865.1 hypothetical protein CBW42_10300 [Butyricicoccus porcorum]